MPEKTLEELVDASSVIFKGTLRNLGASMMPEVPPGDDTAVVTIDSVLASATVLGDLKGTAITIRLAEDAKLKPGGQAIFFTNVSVYGSQLCVDEVGRVDAKREGDVVATIDARPDRELSARLERTELAVAGKVEKVKDAKDVIEPVSEHSPEWKRATLATESVELGDLKGRRVDVLFPGSDEPMFETSPKLQVGQEGVFLLRRGEGPFAPSDAFTILDSRDVHPRAELPRIRKLLKPGKKR